MLPAITVIGRVTHDPELRFGASGTGVCSFTVACNKRKKNKTTDQWEDVYPTFFRCKAFGQLAENVAESITKGMEVIIYGEMYEEKYTGRDGGEKTSYQNVLLEAVGPNLRWATAVVRKAERTGGQQQQAAPPAAAPDPWATEEPPPF